MNPLAALLSGALAGATLPGGGLPPMLAPFLSIGLWHWLENTRLSGLQKSLYLLLYWLAWALVGYRWLLGLDLGAALGLTDERLVVVLRLFAWGINAIYWAVVWSVPFWVALGIAQKWRVSRPWFPVLALGGLALWWPVISSRMVTIGWLTPGFSLVEVGWLPMGVKGQPLLMLSILVLGSGAFLHGVYRRFQQCRWPAWVTAILLLLGLGLNQLPAKPVIRPPELEKVAFLQGDIPLSIIRWGTVAEKKAAQRRYQQLAIVQARHGKRLLILPEEGALADPVSASAPERALATWQTLARRYQVAILLGGSWIHPSGHQTNELMLIHPDKSLQHQAKQWLVPWGEWYPAVALWGPWLLRVWPGFPLEGFQRGPGKPPVLLVDSWRLGSLNCLEVADDQLAEHFRAQGANLLTVSANLGWFPPGSGLQEQFVAHARHRVWQTGLPLVLASNTGPSLVLLPQSL